MAVVAIVGLFTSAASAVEHREVWIGGVVPIFANGHHAGMRLHVAIEDGRVTAAAALVPMESPHPVVERIDPDRFTLRDGRLHGTLTFRRARHRQDELILEVTVDVGLAGDGDEGVWTATADGRERRGKVRVAPTLRPADLSDEAVDLWVHGMPFEGIEDRRTIPPVIIAVTPQGARASDSRFEYGGYNKGFAGRIGATFGPGYTRAARIRDLTVVERTLTPTRLTLRLTDEAGHEIRIEGDRLGRLIIATAERADGGHRGSVVGQTGPANDPVLYDYGQAYATPLARPLAGPAATPESFPVDEALARRALEETVITLPHGRPDRTSHQLVVASYWPGTPALQMLPEILSTHPPGHAFIAEFPPIEGAVGYRFAIHSLGRDAQLLATVETQHPWFNTLDFQRQGAVRAEMVGLDAEGREMEQGRGVRRLRVRSGPSEFWNERMLRGGAGLLQTRYAPAFDFTPVEGAKEYRYQVLRDEQVLASFTGQTPWESLSPVWLEPDLVGAIGEELRVTIQALGPDGNPLLEDSEERRIIRRLPFPGLAVTVDPEEVDRRLLAHMRWQRDHMLVWGNFDADLAATHTQYPTTKARNTVVKRAYAISHSMRQIARLSDDLHERHRALATLERTLEWAQKDYGGATGLPRQQTSWFYPHFWLGLTYLDLYQDTGEERWREAAIYIADRMVRYQLPTGTWGWVGRNSGEALDVARSYNGQDNADHDASEVLYFLGRLRHVLKDDRFRDNERRAHQWVMNHSASSFFWRSQWSHAEMGGGNISTKSAVFFARYLLEFADENDRDLVLVDRILRYCEDQFVTWTDADTNAVAAVDAVDAEAEAEADDESDAAPFIHVRSWPGYSRAGATASLAATYLLMEQQSGDALFGAKGRALLQAVLATQDPQTGNIPGTMQPGKRGNMQEVIHYGVLTRALAESADLLRELEK